MSQFGGVGASLEEGGAQGRNYGPTIGTSADASRDLYLRPAEGLNAHGVAVGPGGTAQPVLLAEANPGRKTLTVYNPGPTTVWVGDAPNLQPGPGPGNNSFPIPSGQQLAFQNREYVGPLYAIGSAGAGVVTVYVTEPFAMG